MTVCCRYNSSSLQPSAAEKWRAFKLHVRCSQRTSCGLIEGPRTAKVRSVLGARAREKATVFVRDWRAGWPDWRDLVQCSCRLVASAVEAFLVCVVCCLEYVEGSGQARERMQAQGFFCSSVWRCSCVLAMRFHPSPSLLSPTVKLNNGLQEV